MYDFNKKTPDQIYKTIKTFLPYKISKKIEKTREARTGSGIYKRRNRRDYRVIIQYNIWNKMMNNEIPNILEEYDSGYAILISPREYFGNNYPNPSSELNKNFQIGINGFVYYTLISEAKLFPPLSNWTEVIEFSTKSSKVLSNWKGNYAMNVKNGDGKVSIICSKATDSKKQEAIQYIQTNYLKESQNNTIPAQCGLGNYDFDYASKKTQTEVELQMLALLLSCPAQDGSSFAEYITKNKEDILETNSKKEKATFLENLSQPSTYITNFNELKKAFDHSCKENFSLLKFEELQKISAVNSKNQTICPLCRNPIYLDEFFNEILQAEGRRVADNTQREIVLMHIDPLQSGSLNHRCYNLAWGHNYCNLIQGDKSISQTINELRRIISSHDKLL